jgi:hypothetical protein
MAEQATLPIDPNAPAPAAGTQAAPTAAPPVVAAVPKPKNRPVQQQQHKKGVIEIPQAAFKARVQREAAAQIKAQTGMSFEDAIAFIKSKGIAVQAGGGQSAAANTAAQAMTQMRTENEKLRKQNERLTREGDQKVKHLEKKLRNERDARVEAELTAEARMAGITDPDYAVTLFARAVGKDAALQPAAFFAGLKATKPHLFTADAAAPAAAAAPATATVPDTAPPESTAAGEVRPQPTGAGGPPKEPNAEEMSPAEFSAHQRRYGFVPGQA